MDWQQKDSAIPDKVSTPPEFEPFVATEKVANFLGITPRRVLELARAGDIPAHPIGHGRRRTWRFRISEVNGVFAAPARTTALQSSLVVPRRQKEKSA
jgi:hypothetical protein